MSSARAEHRPLRGLTALRQHALYILSAFGGSALFALVDGVAHASDPKLLSYGRHLSSECSSCHRIDGVDNGIPSITGWDSETFVATLNFYREGARPNPAMVSVAQSLDEQQMQALAAYYGSLPKPAARKK